MIDEKEIRIGNYFEHNTEWSYRELAQAGVIQWNYSDWYAIGECTMSLENVSPIELTEEWLLKFGFVLDSYHECYVLFQDEDMSLQYDLNPNRVTLTAGLSCHGDRDVNIEYVHQLQNLVFALTGQELTIIQP